MKPGLLTLLLLLSLSGCTGLVVGGDYGPSSQAAQNLGARLVRAEFSIGSSCSSMQPALDAYATHGAKVLLLAGFEGRIPSTAEAQSLASWAQCFGSGSSWARQHAGFAVDMIEFGNETSYCFQFGECGNPAWYASAAYSQRAASYGARFMQARQALNTVGHADVRLLAQADDGGSGSASWVNGLAAGGLQGSAVGGWTVHPYGPDPTGKLGRVLSQTKAAGFPATIPVEVTEAGIAADECAAETGRALDGNHGWPTNLSYSQAAADLRSSLGTIRSFLGGRLGWLMVYKAKDDAAVCAGSSEQHYGALKYDLVGKGAYTTEVRSQLSK